MIIRNLARISLLALAVMAIVPAARADITTTASGDLILAFRDATNTIAQNLEIDLGQYTRFSTLSAGTTVNLNTGSSFYSSNNGGLSASDLAAVYGSNWASNANLVWSVAGATAKSGTNKNNVYVTIGLGAIPQRYVDGVQSSVTTVLVGVRTQLNGGISSYNSQPLVSQQATVISVASADNAYAKAITSNDPSGFVSTDYGYNGFDRNSGLGTESSVSNTSAVILNLWQLAPSSAGGDGTNVGFFTLGTNGSFTFTAAPEPTSVLLLAAGGLSFLARRRRLQTA